MLAECSPVATAMRVGVLKLLQVPAASAYNPTATSRVGDLQKLKAGHPRRLVIEQFNRLVNCSLKHICQIL